jgi:hypothetical protein
LTRGFVVAAESIATLLLAPLCVHAQAWVPTAGQGSVSIAVQKIENTGHILTGGSTIPIGKSRTGGIYLEGEYAITDRLSVAVGIPFVFAKYLGPPLDPEPPMVQPVDRCYCWQSGWQDFGFTARYNLVNGATAVTPSVSFGMPSHSYEYRGEAVVGRNLKEVRLAVDAGRRLDAITPRLAVQARYSYAVVERVAGVPNNRSNGSVAATFSLTKALSVQGTVSRQVTHGGLRAGDTPPPPEGIPWGEITTRELFEQHDRLLRDNHWRAGAGVTLSLSRADVFFSYLAFLGGSDTHAGRSFTAGVSLPFEVKP